MSLNRAQILGHLGSDPDIKNTPGGQAVANFSVATNEVWNDKNGQKQERVEWHRIVVWGKLAENCAKYLSKGRPVFLEGKIQTRKWQDKEGKDRYTTEIIAHQVQFLGSGKSEQAPPPSAPPVGPKTSEPSFTEEDIPF